MRTSGILTLLFFIIWTSCVAKTDKDGAKLMGSDLSLALKDSIKWADYYYNIQRYEDAVPLYKKSLEENPKIDKVHALKKLALSHAALENPLESISTLNNYFQLDFNPNFMLNEGFDPIRETDEFKRISGQLIPKVTVWSLIYLFVALIGFYVVLMICLNRAIHPISRFLIGFFIFIHSFFILNISITSANYMFEYPHTYLMSTWASFLYGPLLFLYFKTTSQKCSLRKVDFLHLIPTVILTAFLIINVYAFSSEEKIQLMLSRTFNGLNPQDSDKLLLLVVLKIVSLAVYGYFIWRVYVMSKRRKLLDTKNQIWQKNIYHIHIFYVLTYSVYGLMIINGITSGLMFDVSIVAMAAMVLYVGYSANIQPDVFNGAYSYINRLFPKYEKSGLTPSLSMELKENLLHLFAVEKIYKENNLNLEMVAQRLNTTRHNASQVINEHFNVSFHEFVNTYRIREAKELLLNGTAQKLNIINIAYEVGYNNKVTFNKAFKKNTQLTPSQYQKDVLQAHH